MEGCPPGAQVFSFPTHCQGKRERMRGVEVDEITPIRAFLFSTFGEKSRRNMG